jgi:hypothetical protein
MTESKHTPTPGPWTVGKWNEAMNCIPIFARGNMIAGAFYLGGTDPANVNARLIAASWNLYEAIRNSDDAHWTPAMRTAMAKVEGREP